jgi:DNA polymerase III subunit delta
MLIKYAALPQHLQKSSLFPLYMIYGSDSYCMQKAASDIKKAFQSGVWEEKKITLDSLEDWRFFIDEANSYALFSEKVLLHVYYEKKTLEASSKTLLIQYLSAVNPRCLIVFCAPHLTSKILQWVATSPEAALIPATPLDTNSMKKWIMDTLKAYSIQYEPQLPDLILQYTEGNMAACAQALEKIALIASPNLPLDTEEALMQLTNQCDYTLYALTAACLEANGAKALRILQQLANTQTEPTLVLWLLAQEIRLLLDFDQKNSKIWPARIPLYQKMRKRISKNTLEYLLHFCFTVDQKIKTGIGIPIWQGLEGIALSLCQGRLVRTLCEP